MTRHLLVVGGQRCGTTYLHAMLEQHPDVAMARPTRPEPKVFLSEDLSGRGVEWYRATYFAHATGQRVLGEKSTSYLEHPAAARRARAVLGEADVVALLRDPVQRAVSNWRFSTANGLEHRPLEAALRENLTGSRSWDPDTTSVSPFAYLERGRYADQLGPWLHAFPTSTHVLFLDELLAGDEVLAGLYDALGVDPAFRPADRREPVNRSDGTSPSLPVDLVEELRAFFAPADAALEDLLGRRLPWRTPVAGAVDA